MAQILLDRSPKWSLPSTLIPTDFAPDFLGGLYLNVNLCIPSNNLHISFKNKGLKLLKSSSLPMPLTTALGSPINMDLQRNNLVLLCFLLLKQLFKMFILYLHNLITNYILTFIRKISTNIYIFF